MASASQERHNQVDVTSIGATMLIAAGLVWLLASFGMVDAANISILFRFWPLVLIGVGLDYFLGRSLQAGISYTLLAVGVLLVLMLLGPSLGLARGAKVTTEQFSEPLENTQSAQISLDLASAPTTVFALKDSAQLFDAEISHIGTIIFDVQGAQEKLISLKREARNVPFGFFGFTQTKWDIGLSQDVPLDVRVDMGSGASTLNLGELELSDLSIEGGSGSLNLSLAASPRAYTAELDAASGSSHVTIADNAELDLRVDVGSGSFTANLGNNLNLNLELRGGSGSSRIELPENAAVRLEVTDDGSGSLSVSGLERLSGSGDEGIWESPEFQTAREKIVINVTDAGSGSIRIR